MTGNETATPLVSVIVPSYNHEKYIAACLDSILNQDYQHFEIIVIDDGSSDNSSHIIKEFAHKDARVTYELNKKNIGLSATLNKALKKYARGKYIIQIASDDMLYEGRITQQVAYMESNPQYGMAYSDAVIIDDAGNKIGELTDQGKSGWLFDDLFLCRFNIPAYTCIYRTNVFEEVGYYDETAVIEDSDIWYKITKKYQVGYLPVYAAYYRRHGANSSGRFLVMYKDTIKRLEKYRREPNYKKAIQEANVRGFYLLSKTCKKEALKIFPKVMFCLNSKFFWGGILNMLGAHSFVRSFEGTNKNG